MKRIDLGALEAFIRSRLAAVEAERDAAQAGEARALEALKAVIAAAAEVAEECDEDTWTVDETRMRNLHDVLDKYEPMIEENPPAFAWLAQQRREAAAEALETARWRPIEECQIASWGDEEHIVWARLNGEWFIAAAQLFKADAIQEGYTHFMRLPKLGSASEEGK